MSGITTGLPSRGLHDGSSRDQRTYGLDGRPRRGQHAHARSRAHRRRDRRRVHRHRRRRLPRHARTSGRQAGHGGLLHRPRRRARDRGLRLRAGGRRRHDPAARATASPTGTPATATSCAGPTTPRHGGSPGWTARPWSSCDLTDEEGAPVEVSPRQILRRQLERAAERGLAGVQRDRARVLPLPRHLRGGGRQGLEGPDAALARPSRTTSCCRPLARSTSCGASATRCAPPTSRSSSPRARPAGGSTR